MNGIITFLYITKFGLFENVLIFKNLLVNKIIVVGTQRYVLNGFRG